MFRFRMKLMWVAAIAALLWTSQALQAQLVVGVNEETEFVKIVDVNTSSTTNLFLPIESVIGGDVSGGPEGIAADAANRVFYWQHIDNLYRTYWDNKDANGLMISEKIADIQCTGCTSVTSVDGLTYVNGTLYASRNQDSTSSGLEGIYTINLSTGEATLIFEYASNPGIADDLNFDARGIAYDATSGLFYVYNNDNNNASSGLNGQGAGIYSVDIDNVLMGGANAVALVAATPSITSICNSCGTSDTFPDIDSIAIGNGKIFLITDNPEDNDPFLPGEFLVYDIATASFETSVTSPWEANHAAAGGVWAPGSDAPPPGVADLAVLIAASSNSVPVGTGKDVGLGNAVTYTFTIENYGAENAASMDYEIVVSGDAGFSIVDAIGNASTPVIAGNMITGSLSPFNFAQQEILTVTVDTLSTGSLNVSATVNAGGVPADTVTINNSRSHTANVRTFPDVEGVFFTSLTGSSPVPGQPFDFFVLPASTGNAFRQIARSPDGTRIVMLAHNNTGSSTDDMIMVGTNGVFEMIALEGSTIAPNGQVFASFLLNDFLSINNSGQVAAAIATGGPTGSDEHILRYEGGGIYTTIAQESNVVPAFTTENYLYGSTMDSPRIDSSGNVSFRVSPLTNAPANEEIALMGANGSSVVARTAIDIPLGQAGGATESWDFFDSDRFWTDATGSNWLAQGDLSGSTSLDDVLVVNGTVVLQEGQGVTGLAGTIPTPSSSAGIIFPRMFSNGDWSCRGTTSVSDQDFVVIGNGPTYSVFAKWGDELETGSGETWSDTDGWGRTFFAVSRNNQGDTVISGRTSNAQLGLNAAAVLYRQVDGTKTVILRENDPIDIDGNGIFDDNAWVRSFIEGEAVLTDAGEFLAHVDYTDVEDANNSGTVVGKAIVRLMVNASPMATGADVFVTKTAEPTFVDNVGGEIVYTVMVCNGGPNDALNVMMTDTLPAEVDFVSATNGATELGGVVSANIGTLAPFACESFEITVATNAEGSPTNTASASSTTTDPDDDNNSGSAQVTIQNQVDVGVSKIDNGGAPVGQQYDYTISVTNAGPAPATDVLVRDTLPGQVTFITASLPFVQNGQDIDVMIPTIAAGGQVDYTITVQADLQALVINNLAVVSLNEVDIDPSNDTFELETINGDVANLTVTKVDSGLTNLGDDITYTIDVTNNGPGAANNIVVTETLPAGVTLVSVSETYVEAPPGVLTINYASIANGASEQITVVVTPLSEGEFLNTVSVTADEIDPDDADNLAFASTRVGNFRDTIVIYSEISGHPTAVVPGARDLAGALTFSEFTAISDLEVSPDGSAWFLEGTNDLGLDLTNMLLIGGGTVGGILAQEGQPVPGIVGEVWDFTDGDAGFNNNNDLAWNARSRGGAIADDEIVMRRISGVDTVAFQEGDVLSGALTTGDVPAPGALLGSSIFTVHLLDDNRIGYSVTPVTNVSSFYYPLLGYDLNVFLQSRADQIDGVNWDSFDSSDGLRTTPDGLHTLILGDDEGPTTSDLILVYDGVVQLREGMSIGSLGPLSGVSSTKLTPNGDWFARGIAGSGDYVIRNGVIIAETGVPILGGAETWGDTLLIGNGNRVGDYIAGGNTSEPDPDYDNVIVMNGDTLVLREGDPVDLNDNGLFDDDIFISVFKFDNAFLTDDRLLIALVTLRDSEGTNLGDAFIQVDLSEADCPTIPGDIDGDGDGDGADVQGAVTCILSGDTMGGQCECLDYNTNGMSDVGDIAGFVADLLDN